jgi:K+-sensing histidine kinase KdpD
VTHSRGSTKRRHTRLFRYSLAGASVALAVLLTVLLFPEERNTLAIFLVAVVVSALYGGLGPGLFAALLSALGSAYFLLPPVFSLRVLLAEDILRLVLFCVLALLISYLVTRRKHAEENCSMQNRMPR